MRQMVTKESETTKVQITANKPARFVCGDVDREYVLPAGFELESATSNGCGMFVRFCSKSQYLKKTSQRKSRRKLNQHFARVHRLPTNSFLVSNILQPWPMPSGA